MGHNEFETREQQKTSAVREAEECGRGMGVLMLCFSKLSLEASPLPAGRLTSLAAFPSCWEAFNSNPPLSL